MYKVINGKKYNPEHSELIITWRDKDCFEKLYLTKRGDWFLHVFTPPEQKAIPLSKQEAYLWLVDEFEYGEYDKSVFDISEKHFYEFIACDRI